MQLALLAFSKSRQSIEVKPSMERIAIFVTGKLFLRFFTIALLKDIYGSTHNFNNFFLDASFLPIV